jgi:hypothetical protein
MRLANGVRRLDSEHFPYIYWLSFKTQTTHIFTNFFFPLPTLPKNCYFACFGVRKWQSKHPWASRTFQWVECKGNVTVKPSYFNLLSISFSLRQTSRTGSIHFLAGEFAYESVRSLKSERILRLKFVCVLHTIASPLRIHSSANNSWT